MGLACSKNLLEEIDDVGQDCGDLIFLVDDMFRAAKVDQKELYKRYQEYSEMCTKDGKKATIRHMMKTDMDTTQFKTFLDEVKRNLSETPDGELGSFSIFQDLERCAKEGWKFLEDVKEGKEKGSGERNFLYYNICRSSTGKFNLAVCYLISGRPIQNDFVFYGGLIKEKLLRKKLVPDSKDDYKLYLKF